MEDTEMVIVYPWLDMRSPISVCGVDFLPLEAAMARVGSRASSLAASTSYFYQQFAPRPPGQPLELQRVHPTVVIPSEGCTTELVEIATDVLAFATIAANSKVGYANSSVFEHHPQRLGGGTSVYSRTTRRMHGRAMNGALIDAVYETRPAWCGRYHRPDEPLLRATESVILESRGGPLRRALDSLFTATGDAEMSNRGWSDRCTRKPANGFCIAQATRVGVDMKSKSGGD